jgi:hypothetical protein
VTNPLESMAEFILRLETADVMPPAPADPPTAVSVARIAEQHPCLYCGKPSQAALHSDHALYGPRWLDLCFPCYMQFVQASDGREEKKIK